MMLCLVALCFIQLSVGVNSVQGGAAKLKTLKRMQVHSAATVGGENVFNRLHSGVEGALMKTVAEAVVTDEEDEDGSCPTDAQGLSSKYNQIFSKSGNRNAASYKWFSYIHGCAQEVGQSSFEALGKGFCPISGSPIGGENSAKVELAQVSGGTATGNFHFCCDPCICDMSDIVKVDTKTILSKQYKVLVHGDPCKSGNFTHSGAPEVSCSGGKLEGATLSDAGHPIIGIFYEGASASVDGTTDQAKEMCKKRAQAGYQSGMGKIFREVASKTPI